jgi:hypothetical protein
MSHGPLEEGEGEPHFMNSVTDWTGYCAQRGALVALRYPLKSPHHHLKNASSLHCFVILVS